MDQLQSLCSRPLFVRKRDGVTEQPFDITKIINAIRAAKDEARVDVSEEEIIDIAAYVNKQLSDEIADVEKIQDLVEFALVKFDKIDIAKHYTTYRRKREKFRHRRLSADPNAIADYIVPSKYSRYIPEKQRREAYPEIIDRVEGMHLRRFAGLGVDDTIRWAFNKVRNKEVLPSMRSMQFGGNAIETKNARIYNCLGRETKFVTSDGVKSFFDFNDGDVISVLTHTGSWKRAVVHSYGMQQLFNITLGRGSARPTIRATRNHQWVLHDGTRTTDIKPGDRLSAPPRIVGDWTYEDSNPAERLYWAMGYIYGDGTLVKAKNGEYKYSMVRLCGDDGAFLDRFKELGFEFSQPPSCNGEAIVYTGKYLKTLPTVIGDGHANVVAFARGYLDADGHKNSNGKWPSEFSGIQSSDKESINFIRNMLPVVGAYVSAESDLTGKDTNYGTRPYTIDFGVSLGFGSGPNSLYTVRDITESTCEVVWCLEVDDDHSFVLPNGIVTGNCCATLIDRPQAFAQSLWLLLCGAGVGYNICIEHVEKLPSLKYIKEDDVVYHTIDDSIEGWAESLNELINSYIYGYNVEFNFTQIRLKGSPLKTSGGKAPGHRELKKALEYIRNILHSAQGRKLRPIECHDILCLAADAVLSGGVRRSSLISIFSLEDSEMMYAKTGDWYQKYPWRQNANNSVGLVKGQVRKEQFLRIFEKTKEFGEPGFVFLTHTDQCFNPCVEISLDPRLLITQDVLNELSSRGIYHSYKLGDYASGFAFCNLTTINAALFKTVDDFLDAAKAASIIGTLQASYTDFGYLGWISEFIARRDALLGVSMTGIMDCAEISLKPEYQRAASQIVVETNKWLAGLIGINPAARATTVKPEGTSSLVLGSVGSGHHAHHARRYIRRVTANPLEPVFQYFKKHNPHMCVEKKKGGDWSIEFVVEAPAGALIKDEISAIQFLEMVKSTQINWVDPGTARPEVSPGLRHNVSNTIHVKDGEWGDVAEYLWLNQDHFSAVSLLSFTGDKIYSFAPFEAIVSETDEHRWNNIIENYVPVDYSLMVEEDDGTSLSKEAACVGGACLV